MTRHTSPQAALIAVVVALAPMARGSELRGRLLDAASGKPLAGRVIVIEEPERPVELERLEAGDRSAIVALVAPAARNGEFHCELPEIDKFYRIEADAPNHARITLRTNVPGRFDATLGDVMLPSGGSMRGRVVSPKGKPVANAFVGSIATRHSRHDISIGWPIPRALPTRRVDLSLPVSPRAAERSK